MRMAEEEALGEKTQHTTTLYPNPEDGDRQGSRHSLASSVSSIYGKQLHMYSKEGREETDISDTDNGKEAVEKQAKYVKLQLHTLRMMALVLMPMIALIGYSSYFVIETIKNNSLNDDMRHIIQFSIELGDVLKSLQLERDQSVLYLSNIGPATKTFLLKQYLDTDEVLFGLSMWPGQLEENVNPYVRSRSAFLQHITAHRNTLDLLNRSVYEEMVFYDELLKIFDKWLYNTLEESRTSTMWKTLVAYQKIIKARLHVGVERALGGLFFSRGESVEHTTYMWYNQELHVFRQSFRMAQNFSGLVKPLESYDVSGENLTKIIGNYRHRIQYFDIGEPSTKDARYWFDNMTTYIDILLDIQTDLADDILMHVNEKGSSTHLLLASSILIVVIIATMIPFLMRVILVTMTNWQNFGDILQRKTRELDKEKENNDALLEKMLPNQMAIPLRQGSKVRAHYFREVTVLMSDIVGLHASEDGSQCAPLELVALLNALYRLFDSRIDLHDVYKIETIGKSYLVTSGLPKANEERHAVEIAELSLDLMQTLKRSSLPSLRDDQIQLRIGVHTGPVIAGIVHNLQLPRFSILGPTVQITSLLTTTSIPDHIHISNMTRKYLSTTGKYRMSMRKIDNRELNDRCGPTYWLLGHKVSPLPQSVKSKEAPTFVGNQPFKHENGGGDLLFGDAGIIKTSAMVPTLNRMGSARLSRRVSSSMPGLFSLEGSSRELCSVDDAERSISSRSNQPQVRSLDMNSEV